MSVDNQVTIYMIRKIGTNTYYSDDTRKFVSQYWGTISLVRVSTEEMAAKLEDVEIVEFELKEK
ncbi:hypothetical protein LCGC14_2237380 [marine sediment metagenome]|uniref:Uncharacterized protein n=1 Tax=marine sediment metagenome TaxID=412755 RepID=A0A0F9DU12_9ZZZZ